MLAFYVALQEKKGPYRNRLAWNEPMKDIQFKYISRQSFGDMFLYSIPALACSNNTKLVLVYPLYHLFGSQ
eukprot:250169-Ditylum_brightwellii.AAC.1